MSKLLSVENISYEIQTPEKQFELSPFLKSRHPEKESRKELLSNISFSIEERKIAGIAGESGALKTTLAKIIAGIIKPSSGSIKFNLSVNPKLSGANPIQILF